MTLTQVAYYIRKIAPFIVLSAILLTICIVTIKIIMLLQPPPQATLEPTPTPAYGQISPITLPKSLALPKGIRYTVETIQGVPNSTDSAKIYFVPKKSPGLNFRDKAALLAKSFDFELTSTDSQFDEPSGMYTMVDKTKRLSIEVNNFNYSFTQDFDEETRQLLAELPVLSEEDIRSKAVDIMKKLTRYPSDLAQAVQTVSYIQYREASGSALAAASIVPNIQDANMVAVDFLPSNINGMQAVTEEFVASPNRVVFIPAKAKSDFIVKAQVKVYERSEEQYSIYPLKSGQEALAELHEGKGFLIQGYEGTVGKNHIKLTTTYPAYLIQDNYTEYIQPVYVFIGENNFVAYVSALAPQWVQGGITVDTITTLSPAISGNPSVEFSEKPTETIVETISPAPSATTAPGITYIPLKKR